VLRGAVDLELRVVRGSDSLIRIECTKAKDIKPPVPMAFRLADVDLGIVDEIGRPVVSAVLVDMEHQPNAGLTSPWGKNQVAVLDILDKLLEQERNDLEDTGLGSNGARIPLGTLKDACRRAGIDRRRFSEAKLALLARNAFQEEDGFICRFSLP
jgi:hypothetical protein